MEGKQIPIWVYVDRVEEDKFKMGYKQAIIKFKGNVLGKLIVNRYGKFIAMSSIKYQLIPNEVVFMKLVKQGFKKEYEDEVMLVMRKDLNDKSIYIINSMDGKHALRVLIVGKLALPIMSKKHYQSVIEFVEKLDDIIRDGISWYDSVVEVLERELNKDVGEDFIKMIENSDEIPQYVSRAIRGEYYRRIRNGMVRMMDLYMVGVKVILNRISTRWDTKLNLIRELNTLFKIFDLLEGVR